MPELLNKLRDGCAHLNTAWPMSGIQRCLDCGRQRTYTAIGTDPGPWMTDEEAKEAADVAS
jgi:hypothetical protein